MNLYDYDSYRVYLKDLCSEPAVQRGFQTRLAKAANCQSAYLSQVLKQKVHLTEDQALHITIELNFTQPETDYFLLLLRIEKAGTVKLRTYLQKELEKLRSRQKELSTKVHTDQILYDEKNLTRYFSSWVPSAIHLLTSSNHYRTIEKISARLRIPLEDTKEALQFLEELGWVEKKKHEYFFKAGNVHIAKDSIFNTSMQLGRRHLVLNSIALKNLNSMHYSSLFTIEQKDYLKLEKMIAEFVQKSSKTIQNSGADDLCCLCVDLFSVV